MGALGIWDSVSVISLPVSARRSILLRQTVLTLSKDRRRAGGGRPLQKEEKSRTAASNFRLGLVFAFAVGSAQPTLARGGGGPPGWTMTLSYCRETVTNKGITDVTKFEQEVKKCFANPGDLPARLPQADVVAAVAALLKGVGRLSPT